MSSSSGHGANYSSPNVHINPLISLSPNQTDAAKKAAQEAAEKSTIAKADAKAAKDLVDEICIDAEATVRKANVNLGYAKTKFEAANMKVTNNKKEMAKYKNKKLIPDDIKNKDKRFQTALSKAKTKFEEETKLNKHAKAILSECRETDDYKTAFAKHEDAQRLANTLEAIARTAELHYQTIIKREEYKALEARKNITVQRSRTAIQRAEAKQKPEGVALSTGVIDETRTEELQVLLENKQAFSQFKVYVCKPATIAENFENIQSSSSLSCALCFDNHRRDDLGIIVDGQNFNINTTYLCHTGCIAKWWRISPTHPLNTHEPMKPYIFNNKEYIGLLIVAPKLHPSPPSPPTPRPPPRPLPPQPTPLPPRPTPPPLPRPQQVPSAAPPVGRIRNLLSCISPACARGRRVAPGSDSEGGRKRKTAKPRKPTKKRAPR
jgi:hypothetical protein